MINEVAEAKGYLDGCNIDPDNLYRICYVILKYFKSLKYSKLEARDGLFEWGNRWHVYIKYDVNFMIGYIWDYDKHEICDEEFVLVSNDDIKQINRRFDHRKVKLLAFAMLCYAKAHANHKKEFSISYVELAAWIGINKSTMYKMYVPEIIAFQYASIVSEDKKAFHKHGSVSSKRTKFKMLVDIDSVGSYRVDNSIVTAFDELFPE